MADGGLAQIRQMVADADRDYEYFRREADYALFRRRRSTSERARLVNGHWISVRRPRAFNDPDRWQELGNDDLCLHTRRYLLVGLADEPLRWGADPVKRFRRSSLSRWVMPPLKGGSRRRLTGGAAERSRSAQAELMTAIETPELMELKEQALLGYEHQRQRLAETEQRANFFLGTAGLTTSLVLANAGLLIGAGKLDPPWSGLAAGALAVASVCAIASGLRAMQAVMISFFRTPPNAVDRVFDRASLKGEELLRVYVAALLVAQGRAGAIGDWKINRLRGARRWFVAAIAGVVFLTAFVLAEAL